MGIVLAAVMIVAFRLVSRATGPGRRLDPAEVPGGGIVVRSEVLHLWSPEALMELARQQARAPVVRDHGGLRRSLELRGQQDLWYALTVRGHQVNGLFADMTVIRRPYRDPESFPEFLNVLAVAGGDPPRDPGPDFSTASIHLIPAELARREPSGAIAELLRHPPPPRLRDTRGDPSRDSRSSRQP
jgi:hypothetical protein